MDIATCQSPPNCVVAFVVTRYRSTSVMEGNCSRSRLKLNSLSNCMNLNSERGRPRSYYYEHGLKMSVATLIADLLHDMTRSGFASVRIAHQRTKIEPLVTLQFNLTILWRKQEH